MPDARSRPQDGNAPAAPPSRFWLWAPYAAILIAALAWSGVWLVMRQQLGGRLEAWAELRRAQGYDVAWSGRRIDGWPFRLDVTLDQPRILEPSGWGLAAPVLKGEADAYAPDRWILVAPQGLSLMRPGQGAVTMTGAAIRASVGGLGTDRPRFSFEGLAVILTPQPGGPPAPIASADRLEGHLQPGPGGQAALLIRIEAARLSPDAPLGRIAAGAPVSLLLDSRLSRTEALKGRNWPDALAHWRAAGGEASVMNASLVAGALALRSAGGSLTVGEDGRLRGALPLSLDHGAAPAWLGGSLSLTFEGGKARLGGLSLGPALKID